MAKSGFLFKFLSLAVLSGATLGMSKLITTFYALELGASASQIGLISAAEAFGMVLLTLPAGLLIDRMGSRKLYVLASLIPAALHLAILCWTNWLWLAAMRMLIGACVPFRSVAMSSLFLQTLPQLGLHRAGWFRGALMIGMLLAGPWLGGWLHTHTGALAYVWVAASFAVMAFWGRSLWEAEPGSTQQENHLDKLLSLLRQPVLRSCCVIEWLSSTTASMFATFIVVLCIDQLQWTQAQAVYLVAAQGLITVLSLFLLSRFVTRVKPQGVYAFSLVAGVVALSATNWAGSFTGLTLAALMLSIASSFIHLANMARLTRVMADKGGVSGLFSLSQTTGMLCGGLFGSLLTYCFGLDKLFSVWALILIVLAVAALHFNRSAKTDMM